MPEAGGSLIIIKIDWIWNNNMAPPTAFFLLRIDLGSIPILMIRFNLKVSLSFLVMGLLVALVKLEIPGNTFLSREINNAMHFPFFGVISLLLLGLSSLFLNRIIRDRLRHYYMAFVMTVAVGALHEYSQIMGPRDADIWDLARDAAGAVTFLGLYMIYDKKMMALWEKWSHKIKLILYIGAVFLILSMLMPSALWGGAYLYRNHKFPLICDFESVWGNKFLKTQDALLEKTSTPYIREDVTGNNVGRLTFLVAEYPGLAIEEPYPDWSGYKSLNFTVFSDMDSPVKIGVRIEDFQHNNDYNDRFNKTFMVTSGLNNISIPLDEVRKQPATRYMDMMNIRAILLFAYKPDEEFVLYFDDFRLE